MNLEKELHMRSGSICELCNATEGLRACEVAPSKGSADQYILICESCCIQIENPEQMDANHWRCLNDSMWSSVPAVQVMTWRLLNRLRNEDWPQALLDMLYLDKNTLEWAKATGEDKEDEDLILHVDSNGVQLQTGDNVVLIKDLNVKGGGFTAKRGTAVRRISLVKDNPDHIEGRVEGQQIVILTKYVKKMS